MNAFICIIGMLLIGVVCYFLGLRRGIISTRHLYDEGWIAAEDYFKRFPELVQDIDDLSKEQQNKYEKACSFVAELDDLFNDECPVPREAFSDPPKDDEIYDCGQY